MRALLLLVLAGVAACDANGPTMKPGENCQSCHHDFTVAGTVFPDAQAQAGQGLSGVTVTVVDADQKTLVLTSNSAGNFYSTQAVAWPAAITLSLGDRTATMGSASGGACASCHTTSGQGRVYLP
jgi:hypothetical protein